MMGLGVRALRAAVFCAGLVVLGAAAPVHGGEGAKEAPRDEVVRAQRFELVGADGTVQAVLLPGPDGCPLLRVRCKGGEFRTISLSGLVESPDPVVVPRLVKGDIIFSQLDRNGFVTSISHFFRELPPKEGERYAVLRADARSGKVVLYRLRNVGTGETYGFADISVHKTRDEDWAISPEGWRTIREKLQAKMRVQIRLIRR